MRNIMARTPHDSSFSSFSKRHFQWVLKKGGGIGGGGGGAAEAEKRREEEEDEEEQEEEETLAFTAAAAASSTTTICDAAACPVPKKKAPAPAAAAAAIAVSRFRAAFMSAIAGGRTHRWSAAGGGGLGPRVTGTLFGRRRGHVHFAFQVDPKSCPVLLIELATPTSGLVREMASGLVRIALECEKKPSPSPAAADGKKGGGARRLLEEPLWRTYCNGKKCGYAVRRECGPADWKVLRAVEPVSMGAGVLPSSAAAGEVGGGGGSEGEMMYMRARFERVVGSRDSEAFYMMNPDGNGGPELSIYLLRV